MTEHQEKLSIENKGEYLFITLKQYHSLDQTQSQITQIHEAINSYNCRKLLVDATATKKQIPIPDLFDLCLWLVDKLGPLQPKIAVLVSPEAIYPDRFGENVVRNRGLNLIRFTKTIQEAAEWLTAEPASHK